MDSFGPRTFLQKLQASRGHTEDDSLGVNQLFRAQTCESPCTQRAPESAKQTGWVQADLMKITTDGAPETGIGFFGDCDEPLRTADNDLQYPCSGGIHFCGQLLSGCVWETRNELVITEPYTYPAAADLSRVLVESVVTDGTPLFTGARWVAGVKTFTDSCDGTPGNQCSFPLVDIVLRVDPDVERDALRIIEIQEEVRIRNART